MKASLNHPTKDSIKDQAQAAVKDPMQDSTKDPIKGPAQAAPGSRAQKRRVPWLDVMKCFGIFAIYLGHFGPSGGYSYDFVYTHHVALFFFVSGCTEALSASGKRIVPYIRRRVRSLLIPYFFFGTASVIVYTLTANAGAEEAGAELLALLSGAVRNSFCAEALWFLTCLFVVQVMFVLLSRVFPGWGLLPLSAGLAFLAYGVMSPSPVTEPGWFYNADSALYYFFYYVLGYLLFPAMDRLLGQAGRYRAAVLGLTAPCLAYALLLYFQDSRLMSLFQAPVWGSFLFNVQPVLVIWLYAAAARCVQDVGAFNRIGRETLYLCGSEYFLKTGMRVLGLSLGFTADLISPMAAYLYSGALIWLGSRFLVPLEKQALRRVLGCFSAAFGKKGKREDAYAVKTD